MRQTLSQMRCVALPFVMVAAWASSGAEAKTQDEPNDVRASETQETPQTRDVVERLKLLKVQMALSYPEIEELRKRTEHIQLQRTFDCYRRTPEEVEQERRERQTCSGKLLTKAISLEPRKEAIILYDCRIYNVRPGDVVGKILIKDITVEGLRIGRAPKKAKTPKSTDTDQPPPPPPEPAKAE